MTSSPEIHSAERARLTGISRATGSCEQCLRELTVRVFQVTWPDGRQQLLGRRCAAKATGYAAGRIEREAAIALRLVELDRRRGLVVAGYPQLDRLDVLVTNAIAEDLWWSEDQAKPAADMYPTWQDYLDRMLARQAAVDTGADPHWA